MKDYLTDNRNKCTAVSKTKEMEKWKTKEMEKWKNCVIINCLHFEQHSTRQLHNRQNTTGK